MRAALLILLCCGCVAVYGADVQVKTLDGQSVQGEYLNTENGQVRIRTRFGVLQIPSKDVVTITAVQAGAAPSRVTPAAPGSDAPRGPDAVQPLLAFPKTKKPDVKTLLALRSSNAFQVNMSKQDRQEILRLTRNFGESSNRSRNEIIQRLKKFGTEAYPFIAAAYTHPTEIFTRAEFLHALAVPNSPLTVGIFEDARNTAWGVYTTSVNTPPPPPPDYLSKRDRERLGTGATAAKETANAVLDIELSASIAGGPLNALLLLDAYTLRYDTETVDALLWDANRDRQRLSTTGNDATKSKSGWSADDRVLVAEQSFPLLFRDDENMQTLPRDLLKKILPSGYPKWDAPQDEWVAWWETAKVKLLKAKK